MTRKLIFVAAILAATFSSSALERPAPSRPQSQPSQPANPAPQPQPAAAPSPEQCPPAGQRISVAIYPIKPAGADASLAAAMSQLLGAKLTPSPKLRVIEEAMLKTVMERQAMNASDACDDTSCQVEIGKLVKAQKMITGGISKLGSKYILSLNLVDIQTGATEFSTEDQCACSEDQLDELVALAAAKVRNHFCEPIALPAISQGQTLNKSATVSNSAGASPTAFIYVSLQKPPQQGVKQNAPPWNFSLRIFVDENQIGNINNDLICFKKNISSGDHVLTGQIAALKMARSSQPTSFSAEPREKLYFVYQLTKGGINFKFAQVTVTDPQWWNQTCREMP